MENKLTCEVVQDLLPSYVEGLTSQVTNEAVNRHLEKCMVCKDIVRRMQTFEEPLNENEKKEIDFLKKNKKRNAYILMLSAFFTVSLVLLLHFINTFFGNPISYFLAKKAAEEYVEQTYAEMNFEVHGVSYDIRGNGYEVSTHLNGSQDVWFFVYTDMNGNVKYDTYKENVLSGENTFSRVGAEYSSFVEAKLKNEKFPYQYFSFWIDLEGETKYYEDGSYSGTWYGMKRNELEIDKVYNAEELNVLGKKYGHIEIFLEDEEVSAERLAEILLDVKAYFDRVGIAFYAIDICLEEKPDANRKNEIYYLDNIFVEDFFYHDIYEEGLTERVQEKYEALWKESIGSDTTETSDGNEIRIDYEKDYVVIQELSEVGR